MFDPLPLDRDKHLRPENEIVVRKEPIIGSFIPAQGESMDHNLCVLAGNVWKDSYGFICSRCTYKKGVPK